MYPGWFLKARQVTLLAFSIKVYTAINEAKLIFIKLKVGGKIEKV